MSSRSLLETLRTNIQWHWETKRTRLLYSRRLAGLGDGAVVERGARISRPQSVTLGDRVRICAGARIDCLAFPSDSVLIGSDSCIGANVCIDSAGGKIEIGSNVFVGSYTYVGGHGGCVIGDDCQIAGFCYIISANHNFDRVDQPIRLQGHSKKGISIGRDCWLGNGVSVVDGVKVGDGCVVAAGAVVTRDTPNYVVLGGVPARPIRPRGNSGCETGRDCP